MKMHQSDGRWVGRNLKMAKGTRTQPKLGGKEEGRLVVHSDEKIAPRLAMQVRDDTNPDLVHGKIMLEEEKIKKKVWGVVLYSQLMKVCVVGLNDQ